MTGQVAVRIMGREYEIACTDEERPALISAAKSVDTRMRELSRAHRQAGPERIAVLVALNLAHELAATAGDAPGSVNEAQRLLIDINRKLDRTLAALEADASD